MHVSCIVHTILTYNSWKHFRLYCSQNLTKLSSNVYFKKILSPRAIWKIKSKYLLDSNHYRARSSNIPFPTSATLPFPIDHPISNENKKKTRSGVIDAVEKVWAEKLRVERGGAIDEKIDSEKSVHRIRCYRSGENEKKVPLIARDMLIRFERRSVQRFLSRGGTETIDVGAATVPSTP